MLISSSDTNLNRASCGSATLLIPAFVFPAQVIAEFAGIRRPIVHQNTPILVVMFSRSICALLDGIDLVGWSRPRRDPICQSAPSMFQ